MADKIEGLMKQAIDLIKQQAFSQAEEVVSQILSTEPEHVFALNILGVIYQKARRYQDAIKVLKRAIIQQPDSVFLYSNIASLYLLENDIESAINHLQIAIAKDPQYVQGYQHLAQCYKIAKQYQLARESITQALTLASDESKSYAISGDIYLEQGAFLLAGSDYNKAISLQDQDRELLCKLGDVAFFQARYESAEQYYQQVKQQKVDGNILNKLAMTYRLAGELDQAYHALQQAIIHEPDNYTYLCNYIRIQDEVCDWKNYHSRIDKLLNSAIHILDNGGKMEIPPFSMLAYSDDLSLQRQVAEYYSDKIQQKYPQKKASFVFEKKAKSKLHIGYLSNDYHYHATVHLLMSFFGHHDREKFKIFAYSYGADDKSPCRKQIMQDVDEFVDIKDLTYEQAAEKIYQDNIDILVDLKGHTLNSRLDICAQRPAPIQVTYLGYPGTTGAAFIDYIIADKQLISNEQSQYYREKCVYMPDCYQANNNIEQISDKPVLRAEHHLPENAVVFCCFNKPYKYTPTIFNCWMEILNAVDNSVLWLFAYSNLQERHLRQAAVARGIDPERIIFAHFVERSEHLARHQLADIFLDTHLVNAHTGASDALRMGLPLIAYPGQSFASRVSASLLTALDLPELICQSLSDYQQLAIKLATDIAALERIKQKLKYQLQTSHLYDTARFVKHIEKAYAIMWQRYLSGEPLTEIEVANAEYH